MYSAHYPKYVDYDTPIEPRAAYDILDNSANKFPDNIAIDFYGSQYSYAKIQSDSRKMANNLRKMGIRKGDRVALYLPNCPEYVISYYAILRLGAIVVNFSPLYSISELKHLAADASPKYIITLDAKPLVEKARKLDSKIIYIAFGKHLGWLKRIGYKLTKQAKMLDSEIEFSSLLKGRELTHNEDINPSEDIALLQYTGGTTGKPKGAALTHANIYINAKQSGMWCARQPMGKGRCLAVLPYFHAFAMTTAMNTPLMYGYTIYLHLKFEVTPALKTIDKYKPHIFSAVPTMYNDMLQYEGLAKYDLTSLEACISGGAPLAEQLRIDFESITNCPLVEGYGLTEASPVVSVNPLDNERRNGSIGMPLPNTKVRIAENGELCVQAPQIMQGYWKNDEATARNIKDGWLHTGDIAHIDDDGYIYITDRLKDMIITGGFNIYPRVVEEAIYKHPQIKECAVIGIADDHFGQIISAYIVTDGKLNDDDLLSFLKEHLGKHELPRQIHHLSALPRTIVGKIDKKALR